MGTRYLRNSPVSESITVTHQSSETFLVEHIYSEETIGNVLAINLRQKIGTELSFVTFVNGQDSTEVIIESTNISPGDYTLILESFDMNSRGTVAATLATNIVTITIEVVPTAPTFSKSLDNQIVAVGSNDSWVLPDTIATYLPVVVELSPDSRISNVVTYDEKSHTVSFLGEKLDLNSELSGGIFLLRITLKDRVA